MNNILSACSGGGTAEVIQARQQTSGYWEIFLYILCETDFTRKVMMYKSSTLRLSAHTQAKKFSMLRIPLKLVALLHPTNQVPSKRNA